MNAGDHIFRGDMARMLTQRPEETKLIGRPATDPRVLERANYFFEHGITREQEAERDSQWRRDAAKSAAISDLQGEPPHCNTRALSPQRARFARYTEWRLNERKKLAALEGKRTEFEAMMAAPAATEAAIRSVIRRAADRLLGRGVGEKSDRRSLDERLIEERHAAEAAREALPELDQQIELARLRVLTLDSREDEFLKPAIMEAADTMGLGKLYLKRLAEFREVAELVFGLSKVAGGYESGFTSLQCHGVANGNQYPIALEFPRMPSASQEPRDYLITTDGRPDVWHQLRQALSLDPYCRADRVVALPRD
jgi:hypothetical protein